MRLMVSHSAAAAPVTSVAAAAKSTKRMREDMRPLARAPRLTPLFHFSAVGISQCLEFEAEVVTHLALEATHRARLYVAIEPHLLGGRQLAACFLVEQIIGVQLGGRHDRTSSSSRVSGSASIL